MRAREQGVALLMVLWASTLLSVLVGGYAAAARFQALQAKYMLDHAHAHYAAEASMMQTLVRLLRGPEPASRLPTDGTVWQEVREGMTISIAVRDERGKIDLNQAPLALLQRWLALAGVDQAAGVAQMIVAWRSPLPTLMQRQRLDNMYRVAGADYGPRGAPFERVEELARIPGLAPETLRQLLPDATLWSGMARPEPLLASARVIATVTGLDPVAAERVWRQQGRQRSLDGAAQPYGMVESLEISAGRGGRPLARLAATVRLQAGDGELPFTVLAWREDGWP